MLNFDQSVLVIICCCFIGLLWAIFNAYQLSKVKVTSTPNLSDSYNKFQDEENADAAAKTNLLLEVASYIERGA